MFCTAKHVVSRLRVVLNFKRTYTSMRLERFDESADMVVAAQKNDLRVLFDEHAPSTTVRASAHCCFATNADLLSPPLR